jgi:hypothetical protein
MAITESSITLLFPDNNFFRFENCRGYKEIQNNFKEMDVCWYEQITDTLYIIELKDWKDGKLMEESDPSISAQQIKEMKEGISKFQINTLVKKSVDSVCMFMSMLLEKPYSSNIQTCSPFKISKSTKIKLLSIINWTSTDVSYIANVNTEYRAKMNPYAKLFGIQTFLVMTKAQALQKFDWIM